MRQERFATWESISLKDAEGITALTDQIDARLLLHTEDLSEIEHVLEEN